MRITQLNHIAIHVDDLARSCRFYDDVLQLQRVDRPNFGFAGAWYRLGVDQELHLIARKPAQHTVPRERHWALMVDDIDAWAQHLRDHSIEFTGPAPRPDNAFQMFLHDPDGHVIELCTPPGTDQP